MGGCHLQYTLRIEATPPSKNLIERSSYRVRADLRNRWTQLVSDAMKTQGVPCAASKRKIRIFIYFNYQTRRDSQNYLCSQMLDAFSRSGLVYDDSPRWMDIDLPVIDLDLGHGHTIIEITDL
jgi:hypothetical protein